MDKITCYVSTKNRYFTTLPSCLISIALQTLKPYEVIIFDDGEHKELKDIPIYQNIFNLFKRFNIIYKIVYGQRIGQVANHQMALTMAQGSFIYRIDDDNVLEQNTLEILYNAIVQDKTIGAVAPVVIQPELPKSSQGLASNKIEDVILGMNLQWFPQDLTGPTEADQLYSTFLFRKEAGQHGYCKELSPVGHCEETIFTYEMRRNGWKLLIEPKAVCYHMKEQTGGIRENTIKEMWQHDHNLFMDLLDKWQVKTTDYIWIVLNNGIGDHYIFKKILPDLQEKYKTYKIIISADHPEIFKTDNQLIITDLEIANSYYRNDLSNFNVYKYMLIQAQKGNIMDLENAYRSMYKI